MIAPVNQIEIGDCREIMRRWIAEGVKVQMCVTSPPYWGLRDYGTAKWEGGDKDCDHSVGGQVQDNKAPGAITTGQRPGVDASQCRKCGARRIDSQLGLESTPEEYVANMVEVFRLVRELLADDGTCWINMGDSYATGTATPSKPSKNVDVGYWQNADKIGRSRIDGRSAGLKPKDLVGIPWRVAFALQADGWYLRQDIIWSKPNPMPESVRDRCTKSHEYLFLLAKSERYYFDSDAIAERVSPAMMMQIEQGYNGTATKDYAAAGAQDASATKTNILKKYKTPDGWDTSKGNGGHGSFHKEGREKGYTGYEPKRSGNKERKPASARGVPVDTNGKSAGAVAGSVPWEGYTRNKRSVWTVTTKPFSGAHFATFPPDLIEPCILAGSRTGDIVLDPFIGSGTTAEVAMRLGRRYLGCELNPEYARLQTDRTRQTAIAL